MSKLGKMSFMIFIEFAVLLAYTSVNEDCVHGILFAHICVIFFLHILRVLFPTHHAYLKSLCISSYMQQQFFPVKMRVKLLLPSCFCSYFQFTCAYYVL